MLPPPPLLDLDAGEAPAPAPITAISRTRRGKKKVRRDFGPAHPNPNPNPIFLLERILVLIGFFDCLKVLRERNEGRNETRKRAVFFLLFLFRTYAGWS